MKLFILIVVCVLSPSLCMWGIDVNYLVPSSSYQCMTNYSIQFAVIKALSPNGEVDTNSTHNLRNARNGGLKTDIYLLPCRGKSASAQIDQVMASISNRLFQTVWIQVNSNNVSECQWGKDYDANCAYVSQLIQRVQSHGKVAGVFSNPSAWLVIMGGFAKCPQVFQAPLWYTHLDGIPSFTGFSPFGGWTEPSMKTYQTGFYMCSTGFNRNYRP